MEAAGLRKIIDCCREFQHEILDMQISTFEKLQAEDQEVFTRNLDEDILRDLSDPYDVYRAIMSTVEGTPAFSYFLSTMQHFLLIRDEPDIRRRYYQLIDHLVTAIVLDKKQNFSGGLSSAIGVSVSRLVAQFGEQERASQTEEELVLVRRELNRVKLQKESLEEEIARGGEGLVGALKQKLNKAEEKLQTSRALSDSLQARIAEQKRGYEEQIQQLELQIGELFKMLRDVRTGSRGPVGLSSKEGGAVDRSEFIANLEKQMERKKTIGILEGRHKKKKRQLEPGAILEEDEDQGDDDPTITQVAKDRARAPGSNQRNEGDGTQIMSDSRANGRSSQFEDPEEEQEQRHIEENLAKAPSTMVRLSQAKVAISDHCL